MAALKFEEAQLNIEKDIEVISSWSQRFDSHSSRQAVLGVCVCVFAVCQCLSYVTYYLIFVAWCWYALVIGLKWFSNGITDNCIPYCFPILALCFAYRAAWMSSTSRTGMQRGWSVWTHCWSTLNASCMWMIWWKLPMMLSSIWIRMGPNRYLARFKYYMSTMITWDHKIIWTDMATYSNIWQHVVFLHS